jgi:antirestriction protein
MENKKNEAILKLAEQFSEENNLDSDINYAYIDNVGVEYSKAEDVEEAFAGEYSSDEAFAQDLAEQTGFDQPDAWPYNCIDWEYAAKEIMYDYFEVNGYYFRNL